MVRPRLKKFITLAAIVASISIPLGCGGLAAGDVARVYDQTVTEEQWLKRVNMMSLAQGKTVEDLDEEMRTRVNQEAAHQLVNEELIRREAENRGLTVTEEEIQASVDKILELRFAGDQEQLDFALEQKGATVEEFRDGLRTQMLQAKLQALIISEMVISDEDALEYFQKFQENYQSPEFRTFKQIVVADEALANELRQRVDAGEDIATLAGQYSIDEQSKSYGGQTGYDRSREEPEIKAVKDVVFSLGSYEVAGPIKGAKGFYIVQLASVSPDKQTEFEPLKEEFKNKVRSKKEGSAWEEFLKEAAARGDVEYRDDLGLNEA